MKDKEMDTGSVVDCDSVTVMLEVDPDGRILCDIGGSCTSDADQDIYILRCLFGNLLQNAPRRNSLSCAFNSNSACTLCK